MASSAPPDDAPPPPPRLIGACLVLVGIGLGGMVFARPDKLHADAWVGVAVGAAFGLAGLSLLTAPSDPTARPFLQGALGASIFTVFTALISWWAFLAKGGGVARIGIGPVSFAVRSARWAWLARAPIAFFAALCALGAAWAWKDALDRAEAARPGSRAPLAALVLALAGWGAYAEFKPVPPPELGAPVVEAPLRGTLAAGGAGAPQVHGGVTAGPDGTEFDGETQWLDYAVPKGVRLDATAALEVEARVEPMPGRRRSLVETLAAAGPYVIDAEPSSGDWRVKASVGECALISEPLPSGTWTKVGLAWDEWAGRAALLVDGKVAARVSCPGPLPAERLDYLRVGTWHESYQAFRGGLRGVRLTDRVKVP